MEALTWAEHLKTWTWQQGEHITLVGTTGCGKTTLAQAILPERKFVIVLAAKPKDPVVSDFKKQGYQVFREWNQFDPREYPRVIFWPTAEKSIRDTRRKHSRAFEQALEDAFNAGGWAIYVDEAQYFSNDLRLAPELEHIWQQGRAMKVSLVVGNQRPRYIPLAAYSQASHLFVWGNRDRQDAKRIAEISGHYDSKEIEEALRTLPSKHHCLYLDSAGMMYSTLVE